MGRQTIAKATPSLGMVSLFWSRCTETVIWPSNTSKAIFYLRDRNGNEIAEVRNQLVQAIINYDEKCDPVSHIFWVDDDVLVQPGCLLELLSHNRDIASGVYFQKMPGRTSQPLIYPSEAGGVATFIPNQTVEVWGHGMGLCLIKLDVYKRMRDELKLPLDKYGFTQWYHTTELGDNIEVDENGVVSTGYTEDLFMLKNAAKLGYKPLVDTSKHAFAFHYDAKNDKGYPELQYSQWVAGQSIEWETPNGKVIWD